MARALGGDKFVCTHNGTGGWGWVSFAPVRVGTGWGLVAPCTLGDHYIQADLSVGPRQHWWPTKAEALAALDQWRSTQ